MRGNDLLDKMELIDPAYIEAADIAPRIRKHRSIKRWAAIAACFVLLLSIGMGTLIYAAEVKEYKEAVSFFEFYGLSSKGLVRREIKAVYRDITTKSFTYSKTTEVIKNSLSAEEIQGYDIFSEDLSPEDIENIWNNNFYKSPSYYTGVRYAFGFSERADSETHIVFRENCHIKKYDGTTVVWKVPTPEFDFADVTAVSDGVLAYGHKHDFNPFIMEIIKIDKNGNVMWKHKREKGFDYERIYSVLENEDGSYAVMSSAKLDGTEYFCFSQYTADGKEKVFKKTEMKVYAINKVMHFKDGYIVQYGEYGKSNKIIRIDYEGNITDSFIYSGDGIDYDIKDMIEFNGKIYLSVDAFPSGKYQFDTVCSYIRDKYGMTTVANEDITSKLRENYTAMLLVCDSKGNVKKFYSVKGSFGGELSVSSSNKLVWTVENIATVSYNPYLSSHTFGGKCCVYKYTFNSFGRLVSQEKTDEVTNFWK